MNKKPLFLYIPLSEKILFVKHFSIMMKSGMTMIDSLVLLKKQTRSTSLAYVLESVVSDVQNGQFLSESLRRFRAFDPLFVNVIKVGEETGTLADNLLYLSTELKKKQQLRQKLRAALIYPLVILFATLGVTGVLIFFVMPRLLPVFVSLRVELPASTKILIGTTTFFLEYGLWVIGAATAVIIGWIFLLRIRTVKFFTHRLILLLPFMGSLSRMSNTADFTRTLGLLIKSGIKIVESILIASESVENLVYRRALKEAAESVRQGQTLDVYLGKNENLFFPTVTRMIEVGNITGTLQNNLFYLADFYEGEIDEATKNLSTILEPILLLVMGGIVGFVAISIITPIYQITQTFGR